MSVARSLPTFTVEAVRLSACWTGGTQAEVTPCGRERVDMTCVWVFGTCGGVVSAGFGMDEACSSISKRKGNKATEVPGDRYEVCALLLSMLDLRRCKIPQHAPKTARELTSVVGLPKQKELADLQATINDQAKD